MNGSFDKQKKEVRRTTEKETGMGRWLVRGREYSRIYALKLAETS